MHRWSNRLAVVAGTAALTLGLPAMGAAYGVSQSHRTAEPPAARAVARLDRLGHRALFAASVRGELNGVDVRARDHGWAVGSVCVTSICAREDTLIEHWNGRRWVRVPSPNVHGLQTLVSVSAVSASDAWAVGIYATRGDEAIRTLIVHWNGRRWSRVPSPNPDASPKNGLNFLFSVTAVSGRDAWAAGEAEQGASGVSPLIVHWNGTRWSTVPSPHRTNLSGIISVSAASARDIWAVGDDGVTANHALIEHWNGSRWRIVAAPARPRGQIELMTVTALSARSAWAVGAVCADHCEAEKPPSRAVILHWNGRRWAAVASPAPGAASLLTAVAATSARNAWAVGQSCAKACALAPLTGGNQGQILILHWNGTRWSRTAVPHLGAGEHNLASVSALSRSAWAVGLTCTRNCAGDSASPPVTQPLTLRWNGQRWLS